MSSIPFRDLLGFIDDEDFQTFVQTTEPGKTVFSKTHRAPVERRVDLTSMIEDLEFLAADSRVSSQALASKIKQARRALMGSVGWSHASYADPRRRWDASGDLKTRLDDVQQLVERRFGAPIALLSW